jgi:hypothetical protein
MATDRAQPAQDAGEREMLTGWLVQHRKSVDGSTGDY